MTFKDIVTSMKKYEFKKQLLWLQVVAIHPSNQIYQMRFEYLIACLLTIKKEEFKNSELSYSSFKSFLMRFFKQSSSEFNMLEDFLPYSQLKLIPYFYNGHKYFFFYGNLERPWEFVNKLDYLYLKPAYSTPDKYEDTFVQSLEFQSNLLKKIVSENESLISDSNCLFIPCERYLDKLSPYFIYNDNPATCKLDYLTPGCLSLQLVESNKMAIYKLLDKLLIKHLDSLIYILPQLHIEILFDLFNDSIFDAQFAKKNLEIAHKSVVETLTNRAAGFFGKRSIVPIFNIKRESLLRSNEIAIRIGEDQIILFHTLRVRHKTQFNMESAISKVKKRVDELSNCGLICFDITPKDAYLIPSEILNFQGIIIFQHTGISTETFGVDDLSIPFFAYDDIIRIFELLNNPVEFLNYVMEHKALHKRHRVVLTDQLDELAVYLQNNKSFLESGVAPSLLHIQSHSWHNFYTDFLYTKYSENIEIHEFIEQLKPYYFDYVDKISDGTYEIFNNSDLMGGTVLLLSGKTYFINSVMTGNQNHFQITENFLKPLLNEYLFKLDEAFSTLIFSHLGTLAPKLIYVDLVPYELLENDLYSFLVEEANAIKNKNPLHITVRWRKSNEPHIFVLFDAENMDAIFSDEMNYGERITIYKLTLSLLKYFLNNDNPQIDSIAHNFTDKYLPVGRRRFGVEVTTIKNPRLNDYHELIKATETDLSILRRQTAEYIASTKYRPGDYMGAEAKKIIEVSYHFLQEKLQRIINSFNDSFWAYAYQQLEYVEGKKEKIKHKAKMDKRSQTDFDVVLNYTEKSNELSLYSIAIKHLITSALKESPSGSRAITSYAWREIIAISQLIVEITQTYDYIENNLTEYVITITDLYEIQGSNKDIVFDDQKYAYDLNQDLLSSQDENPVAEKDQMLEDTDLINKAFFESFKFTFQEMLMVLSALGVNDFEHTHEYPINKMGIDNLTKQLSDWFPEIRIETIHLIIEYLSLTSKTYDASSNLIPSILMRKKERLNLCPIIILDGKAIWGNQMCLSSSYFWQGTVSSGDFPYTTDCPKEINQAMKTIHRKQDKRLEKIFANIAKKTVGEAYVLSPILKFDSIHKNLPRYPDCGEIDLLVLLPSNKKIIVGEAKNRNKRSRAYDIQLEHRDFFNEKNGYFSKLQKKHAFVSGNLSYFLEYFNIKEKEGWSIESVFLVNSIYTSAFLGHSVRFIHKNNFNQFLLDESNKPCLNAY